MSNRAYFFRSTALLLGAALSMAATGVFASTAQYTFAQTGWSGGGSVVGAFSGADLNNDGFIDFSTGEVNSYEMSFSGNSVIPAFQHSFADLGFLHYLVGSSAIVPPSYAYSFGSGYFYDPDDHLIATRDLSVSTFAYRDAVVVSAVPEPGTTLLLGLGVAVIALVARKRNFAPALKTCERRS
jgi:hypothetical protein